MANRIRLIDIANRLNISKVTVSKALRNQSDISTEMIALVQKTAEEMGYTPNLLARSLNSNETMTLGVVIPKIAHNFFSSVLDAVQEEASKGGYGILLAVSNENAELESQHIKRLLSMRVDGLLVSASKEKPDRAIYERVQQMQVPLVFFDRRIENTPFSSVTVDDEEGAFDAVQYLIKKGCTRIAHVGGSLELELGRARRIGYEKALKKYQIPLNPSWLVEGGFDEKHGYSAFKKILETGDIPDAVFAVSFPVGIGIYAAIHEHDPEMIDRFQLITFGAGRLNEFYAFPHYCICQPTREIGRKAVDLILKEIQEGIPDVQDHIVLPTSLLLPRKYPTF